jgi:outer membrane receptor protein involved in Fe transport
MIVRLLAAGLVLAFAVPAAAQQDPPKPPDPQDPEQPYVYEEQVVVSASKVEQQLVNAPAAVSVVTSETIQNSPATNIGDLLRAVPGLNVSQTSARDVNITTRGATSTLSTSQLALVDGRSVYLDFFGMVMWDLLPTNPNDIKQIEVIRGPASAVWGANAMTGVVNVITKTPRELAAQGGTSFTLGLGTFDRDVPGSDLSAGSMFYVNGSHAQAVDDRWAFKLSAGYLTQDPLPRPTGTIPNGFNTPYPSFINEGTSQPKFDARVDYDLEAGNGTLTFAGGLAGTEGLIHTGIGPFDISSDSRMSYFTTRYTKGGRRVAFFTNLLDGDAANLLAVGPNGLPLPLVFDTKTFDFEANDVHAIGTRQVLSYGGNFRHNKFDISIAPNGDDRNEGGAYLQDEIFLSDHFRWVVGGRIDKFSSIEDAVFSPRTTFMVKPTSDHTLRVSFNRAFRAPSFINNNIETRIINELNLGLINPLLQGQIFRFPITALGNSDLKQETMTAYELGYTGQLANNRIVATAAVYWNETKDSINFAQLPGLAGRYSASNPPPGWPLPPIVLEGLAAAGRPLPSTFSYLNLGTVRDKGIELGIDASINRYLNVFTNYSHQWDPEPKEADFPVAELNLPPNNRFNVGFNFTYARFLGNMSVSYTDEAFWQDVLDQRFHGSTDPYTLVNAAVGVRWAANRVVTSLKVTNLTNDDILQHIFGDVTKRQVVGEARFTF